MKKCLAITGIMGAGKSTFANKLAEVWQSVSENHEPLKIIEVDQLKKEIIISDDVKYTKVRKEIAQEFGVIYQGSHYQLDRYSLSQKIFASRETMETYNELTAPCFKETIEQEILLTPFDVAIVWSHVIENQFQSIFQKNNFNGLIVYLTVSPTIHQQRIFKQSQKEDGLPLDLIQKRVDICLKQDEKIKLLKDSHYPYLLMDSENNNIQQSIQNIISKF